MAASKKFKAPNKPGDLWTVFEFNNSSGVTRIRTVGSESSSANVDNHGSSLDTTAPTVTSVSTTADNQSAVSITDNITVTFSEAMDYTSITTNIDNSSCYGTLMVSSDNFSNCVQMASPNKALDFDGTNDYVDVGDFSLGGSLTFEAWMQYDSRATWSRVFDFGENGASDDNIWLGLAGSSGTIRFEILSGSSKSMVTDGDGEHTAYGQVPIDGTWIHVAATISGTAGSTNGTGKLFVNGNLVGTKTNMYVPAVMTRNNQYLGKSNWNDPYLNAKMDEFRIWNYVRSQQEIQATMNNTLTGSESGLVAYYKMNDGSGTSLADSSSNSNTATLNNMTDSDWIQGNASFSDSPSSMTFTLDPSDNLTVGTTYLTRVTTGVKDASGNAMSSQYDNSNGFTTVSFQPQTKAELQTAVDLWTCSYESTSCDNNLALATYGEINTWDVSLITSMDKFI